MLNGYRIGAYPAKPLKGNPLYVPPAGFIEVTKDNQDTKVSPHFALKQFLCKEDTSKQFPKLTSCLKERLPLEARGHSRARQQLRDVKTDTLHIMSAYRTPLLQPRDRRRRSTACISGAAPPTSTSIPKT